MKKLEDIHMRLKSMRDEVKIMNDASIDDRRAFRFLFNNILDILDDLEYLDKQDDLFDDDAFVIQEVEEVDEEFSYEDDFQIKPSKWIIDPDDLI
jgi:hypothetical protein